MAVYTKLGERDIKDFLSHYDAGELRSFDGIVEGIDNTNYLVVATSGKKYILTIFESRIRPGELPYFLSYMNWLATHGVPSPAPVAGRDGEAVRMLKGKPAALVQFLEGRGNPDITPTHMELVGELAANMHVAARDFPMHRANGLSLPQWQVLFSKFESRADEVWPGLAELIAEELKFLETHWPASLPAGAVHADLFPDNVFFTAGSPPRVSGVIDCYFACTDWWAYDLMIILNAWCFDDRHRFVPERASALLQSYQKVRKLQKAELAALPLLARASAMRFLVTRAHDWIFRVPGALVNPKNPMDYVMRLKFHQSVPAHGHYGA